MYYKGEKAKGWIILVLMVVQFCDRMSISLLYEEVTTQLHPCYTIYNHIELHFRFSNKQNK